MLSGFELYPRWVPLADVLQNCPVAPHFTSTASLLDCPSTRIIQVRVDGQSSSDTVGKNGSH